jgi:Peptidase family C25/Propeptide_C25/Domain of unknown function DUF11
MFRKIIISPLGEVTQDRRTIGDRIRYRIYYGGLPALATSEVTIVDTVDENLSEIRALHDGVYDRAARTVSWTVPAIRFKRNAYVEFEATVAHEGIITNKATVRAGFSRPVPSNAVTITAAPPPRLGWIPLREDAERGTPPRSYLKDETTTGITVRFDLAGLFVHDETIGGVAFQHVTIPGRATTTDVGRPELPVIGEIIEVPFGVDFAPVIVNAASVQFTGYNIYPAQEPRVERQPGAGTALAPAGPPGATVARQAPFAIDAATYRADADYPSTPVSISAEDIGVIRGHRVLFLKVEPVQYNPVTQTLTVHNMIEVWVRFSHPAQVKGADARLRSRDFDEMLSAAVLNYKLPERLMPEGGGGEQEPSCDYLIITHDAFYTESDPANPVLRLADWKRRKGYRTKVVKVSMIPGGGNTPSAIQAYLQHAYDNWSTVPTYVLLVGEADLVRAVPGVHHPLENDQYTPQPQVETDLRYVTVDGSDYFPDLFIGRISADTLQQVSDTVDKIIKYEQDPPADAGFYANVSLAGLFTETDETPPQITGQEDRPWIANMETIRGFLANQGYTVERIYATDSGFPANPNAQDPRRFNDGTSLPNDLLSPQYGWNGNATQISNAINAGRFLITYRAHGSWSGWAHPSFGNNNVQALTQNDLTPLVISVTCQTGWFDNETDDDTHGGRPVGDDCFAEAMLRRPHAGAVGLLGMTRNSYTGMNDFLVFGAHKAIWPDFDPDPPWAGHPQAPAGRQVSLRKFGQVANFSKMYMARAYAGGSHRQLEFEMHHLFGDPETTLWTSAPHGLSVDHPAGIGALGTQEFTVKVRDQDTGQPVGNATVVLTRDHSIVRMEQTGTDGVAVFRILNVGASASINDLDLTVTALDHRPYLGTLPVTQSGAELNRIDPGDGPEGQVIHVGGRDFTGGETVEIYFGQLGPAVTTADSNGEFGQAVQTVDLTVPVGHQHGLVNVSARGMTSQRSAVRLFQVRDKNPVDLWTYDQWATSTWAAHPGDNPTWNSPDIQLYDSGNNPVDSANLVFGEQYTVKATIRNNTSFAAPGASVVFRWADFGAGGPWENLAVVGADIKAGPAATTEAQTDFQPPGVGHLCLQVTIEHVEDIDATNNVGQENLHIGFSHSAAEAPMTVWNPTDHPTPVYFEVRQLFDPAARNGRLWETSVRHPDPQMLNPGEAARAYVVVDPGRADVPQGTKAEFAVTCFIDGTMIGGVNLMITKR